MNQMSNQRAHNFTLINQETVIYIQNFFQHQIQQIQIYQYIKLLIAQFEKHGETKVIKNEKFRLQYNSKTMNNFFQIFSDALPYIHMLQKVKSLELNLNNYNLNVVNWRNKLSNLKLLLKQMQQYIKKTHEKSIMYYDIDLIQIANFENYEHINKFFEIVIAVLMLSENKEYFIETIMKLDQNSQQNLVDIIQNAQNNRIIYDNDVENYYDIQEILQKVQKENYQLYQEIQKLENINQEQKQQCIQMKIRMEIYEEQIRKMRNKKNQNQLQQANQQTIRYNSICENLKTKLIEMSKIYEVNQSRYQETITNLEQKLKNVQEIKQQYQLQNNKFINLQSQQQFQKQKIKFKVMIGEKDSKIDKFDKQLQKLTQKNISLQDDLMNAQIEIQRKTTKNEQLNKKLRNNYSQPKKTQSAKQLSQQQENIKYNIEYLEQQNQKLKNQKIEYQKQNIKLKKKNDNINQQINNLKQNNQSKKYREQEFQLLLVSYYNLYHSQKKQINRQ